MELWRSAILTLLLILLPWCRLFINYYCRDLQLLIKEKKLERQLPESNSSLQFVVTENPNELNQTCKVWDDEGPDVSSVSNLKTDETNCWFTSLPAASQLLLSCVFKCLWWRENSRFYFFLHTEDWMIDSLFHRELYFSIRQMSVIFLLSNQTFCWSVFDWTIK